MSRDRMKVVNMEMASVAGWTFLTNHAHVLVCLRSDPNQPLRTVALRVGITERAVQRIVRELEEAGVIERRREGRQNRYEIHADLPLRHPLEAHRTVGDLLRLVVAPGSGGEGQRGEPNRGRKTKKGWEL